MKKNEFIWIFKVFVIWRIGLEVIIYFASKYITLQKDFLGIVPWANYDAEHYISIARSGYKPLEYFYFPLYPLILNRSIQLFALARSMENFVFIGYVVSQLAFFIALVGLYKLVVHKFSEKVAKLSIILLLTFPTSYYFASVYTESLFLMLVVWSFCFFGKKRYLYAGILGAFASAARSTGVILFPSYLIYIFINKKLEYKQIFLFLIPSGLAIYMYYLNFTAGNAFAFNDNGFIFGEYRSASPVMLPQVFYRYIFKILPILPLSYFPVLFTTWLEFISACIVFAVLICSLRKIPLNWWIYSLGGFLAPTLYLNFVSMPRYTLVLFPIFVYLAIYFEGRRIRKYLYISISCLCLIIALSFFSRGYWVS